MLNQTGRVSLSSPVSQWMADSLLEPHISSEGCSPEQTAGRSGWPKMAHLMSGINWTHGTPAGLPWGMPGMGLVMEGAMQQAPQPVRHCKMPEPTKQFGFGSSRLTADGQRPESLAMTPPRCPPPPGTHALLEWQCHVSDAHRTRRHGCGGLPLRNAHRRFPCC